MEPDSKYDIHNLVLANFHSLKSQCNHVMDNFWLTSTFFLDKISYSCFRSLDINRLWGKLNFLLWKHLHIRFERDGLVGVGHHGDEHVEEDDHVTTGVHSEH